MTVGSLSREVKLNHQNTGRNTGSLHSEFCEGTYTHLAHTPRIGENNPDQPASTQVSGAVLEAGPSF